MTIIKRQINYFNEALLLATRIYNTEESQDSDLPMPGQTLAISKEILAQKHKELVAFLHLIRTRARKISEEFGELTLLFRYFSDENRPELLYFLTYSYLEQSITSYSQEGLLALVKAEFIENMTALGYQLTTDCSFDEIDQLVIFNEQQRYTIYKLLSNVNQMFERFYSYLSLLEQAFQEHEHMISEKLNSVYDELEQVDLLESKLIANKPPMVSSHEVDTEIYTCFVQSQQLLGRTMVINDERVNGFHYIGLLPYLLQHEATAEEKQEEMFKKFSLMSDATRFNILMLLGEKPRYGRELSRELSISAGTISHHLSHLLDAGIIVSEIRGKKIYYNVNRKQVQQMGEFLVQLGGGAHDQ